MASPENEEWAAIVFEGLVALMVHELPSQVADRVRASWTVLQCATTPSSTKRLWGQCPASAPAPLQPIICSPPPPPPPPLTQPKHVQAHRGSE